MRCEIRITNYKLAEWSKVEWNEQVPLTSQARSRKPSVFPNSMQAPKRRICSRDLWGRWARRRWALTGLSGRLPIRRIGTSRARCLSKRARWSRSRRLAQESKRRKSLSQSESLKRKVKWEEGSPTDRPCKPWSIKPSPWKRGKPRWWRAAAVVVDSRCKSKPSSLWVQEVTLNETLNLGKINL